MLKKIVAGVFYLFLAFIALMIGVTWWASRHDDPSQGAQGAQAVAPAISPERARKALVQAAISQGEVNLIAHIKASMHDPDSFELVNDRAIDAGDHITMVMWYRGRNGFNALRKEAVGATFDLQGNITSVQKIE